MGRIVLFICLLSCSGKIFPQNIFTDLRSLGKRADYYYSRLAYVKAADLYSQALKKKKNKKKVELNRKAAGLFKKLSRYEDAKLCFENSISSGYSLTTADSIQYFNVLCALGDLKADTIFTGKFSNDVLNNLFRDSLYYNLYELPFNTNRPEYCPVVLSDGIMFVSEDLDTSLVKKYNALNNGGFASLYYAAKTDSGWSSPVRINAEDERILHIGPVSFYDNSNAILTICKEEYKEPYRLQLFQSIFNENILQWENFSPLSLNNFGYSIGHPAISQDGKKLFFVSDREGGLGGTDIYVCENRNGTWSEPRNLGEKINTSGDEKFPYLIDDILFFSSDGRYGMGGLDIYYVDFLFQDSIVVNMGYPVNSSLDDFGFSYHKENKTGYFSSNRKSHGKDDDLYLYTENRIFLDITVYDDFNKKGLAGYSAELMDLELKLPVRCEEGDNPNNLKAILKPAHRYRLIFHKDDYINDTLLISTYNLHQYAPGISKMVYLKRKPVYYASLKFKSASEKDFEGAVILVNNLTENKLDTLEHSNTSATIKLDGLCEYIITSSKGDKLRYIYVERKSFAISETIPFYNLYLGAASPSILHVRIRQCSDDGGMQEFNPKVKVWDWVNRNEFNITPGPEGDFQLVVTDSRLFYLYVDGRRIHYSKENSISDNYCIQFMP